MEDKTDQFTENTDNHFIMANDAVDVFISRYFNGGGLKLSCRINEKASKLSSEHFSYRIINYWEKEGLISNNRPYGKGWRMYSILDRVWLEIIVELRQFGYPIEHIRTLRERLTRLKEANLISEMPWLEGYFVLAMVYREPAYLLVFPKGEAHFALSDNYDFAVAFSTIGNHIKININQIVQRLYPDKDLKPKLRLKFEPTDAEKEIIIALRTKDYQSISIIRKNGKVDRLEMIEEVDTNSLMTDLLKDFDFQDFEVKQHKGKVVRIKRTIKKQL